MRPYRYRHTRQGGRITTGYTMDCIGTQTLGKMLEYRSDVFGGRECIVFEDNDQRLVTYSYHEVNLLVNKYAGILLRRGIGKSTKVIVHMKNCPEFIFSWFALAKIGAVMVPTNVLSSLQEIEYFAQYADAEAVITEPEYVNLFTDIRQSCPAVKQLLLARTASWYPNSRMYPDTTVLGELIDEAPPEAPAADIDPEDDLMIVFTPAKNGGTRAVRITHANAVFAGIFGAQAWKVTPLDRHFMVLPLFHINGQFISVMPTLTAGATLIMTEQFIASRYMEQARAYGVTTASLVAATVRMLLSQPPTELDSKNSLRLAMYAIAITDEEWDAFESRFNIRLCDLWGLTETLGATTINPIDGRFKRNCIGMPRLGTEVMVVNDQGNPVPPETQGEIIVRGVPGRTLMKDYYKDSEATEAVMRSGWLHTGDIGYMDADGYFHI